MLISLKINSQYKNSQKLPELVPTAPNAAALAKSIDYPVSYNTGTVAINLPIDEVSVDGIDFVTQLNCDTRGFSSFENEGVYGLGWTNSGNIEITRVVNGMDDFYISAGEGIYGYFYYNKGYNHYLGGCDQQFDSNDSKLDCGFKKLYDIEYLKKVDNEPDKFYYSLPSGKKGAFYLQKRENEDGVKAFRMEIVQLPYTGVKIEIVDTPDCSNTGVLKIVDIDGSQYFYGNGNVEVNTPANVDFFKGYEANQLEKISFCYSYRSQIHTQNYITSWKCYKIITGNKEENIEFTYKDSSPLFSVNLDEYVKLYCNKEFPQDRMEVEVKPIDVLEKINILNNRNGNDEGYLNNNEHNVIYGGSNNSNPNYSIPGKNINLLDYPVHYTKHSARGNAQTVFPTGEDDLVIYDSSLYNHVVDNVRRQSQLVLDKAKFPDRTIEYVYSVVDEDDVDEEKTTKRDDTKISKVFVKDLNDKIIKEYNFYLSREGDDNRGNIGHLYADYYDGSTKYLDSVSIISKGKKQTTSISYKNKSSYENYPYADNIDLNQMTIRVGNIRFGVGPNFDTFGQNQYAHFYPKSSIGLSGKLHEKGMISSIKFPTGRSVGFDFESNFGYMYYDGDNTDKLEQVEGFRIKSISYYHDNKTLLKQFKYGVNENGGGISRPLRSQQTNNDIKDVYFGFHGNFASSGVTQHDFNEKGVNVFKDGFFYPNIYYLNNYYTLNKKYSYKWEYKKHPFDTLTSDEYCLGMKISEIVNLKEIKKEDVLTLRKNTYSGLSSDFKSPVYYEEVAEYSTDTISLYHIGDDMTFEAYNKLLEASTKQPNTGKVVYKFNTNSFGEGIEAHPLGNYTKLNAPREFMDIDNSFAYGHLMSKTYFKLKIDGDQRIYIPIQKVENKYELKSDIDKPIDYGKTNISDISNLPFQEEQNKFKVTGNCKFTGRDIAYYFYNLENHSFPNFFKPNYSVNHSVSSFVKLIESTTISYFNEKDVKEIIKYDYNSTTLLDTLITKSSNLLEDSEITSIKYTSDVLSKSSLGSPDLSDKELNYIDTMQEDNRLNIPLQKVVSSFYDGNVLSNTIERYKYGESEHSNLILPTSIMTKKGSYNKLEERIIYHSYSGNGNPTEVSKKDGTHISYIWGYQQQHPIAKIENATLDQVEEALISLSSPQSIAALQNLSDSDKDTCISGCAEAVLREALHELRTALLSAQVTTYTYDPLVGVTSITDPRGETIYYQYDTFQRLELVKDAEGNVLRKNEYNYKN